MPGHSSTTRTRHTVPGLRRAPSMVLTAVAATLVLLLTGAPAALAHDELVATTPEQDATVPTSPLRVELEFSGPAQPLGTQVLVSAPDGAPVSRGSVELRDTTVVQSLVENLPAGIYTVRWRVTSSDGHPLSGAFDFTVAEGPTTAPSEQGAAAGEPGAPTAVPGTDRADIDAAGLDQPTDSSPPVIWLVLAAVLLLTAAGLLVRRRRSRS